MEIVEFSKNLFHQRSELLQKSLRPHCNLYPIEKEYPIVLSEDNPAFSICVTKSGGKFKSDQLIAHVNFWPRIMMEESSQFEYQVALLGNVATNPAFRGCGVMKYLLENFSHQVICEF